MRTTVYSDQESGAPLARIATAGLPSADAGARAVRLDRVGADDVIAAARAARAAAFRAWASTAWHSTRRAGSRLAAEAAGALGRWIEGWRERRERKHLAAVLRQLDRHVLRDMGIENLEDFLRSPRPTRG